MSGGGFRTLVVASRRLGGGEYDAWAAEYKEACASLSDREDEVCNSVLHSAPYFANCCQLRVLPLYLQVALLYGCQ